MEQKRNMTVGIVGLGLIGGSMAIDLARRGFASRVIGVEADPVNAAAAEKIGLVDRIVDFDDCMEQSDLIVLAVPVGTAVKMLPEVLDRFRSMEDDSPSARKMKKTAYFINTARPALVDMDALYRALKENWITGAGIDVWNTEPMKADDPFLQLDNLTATCHKGGDTVESYADSPEMVLTETERWFNGETPRFLVNPET